MAQLEEQTRTGDLTAAGAAVALSQGSSSGGEKVQSSDTSVFAFGGVCANLIEGTRGVLKQEGLARDVSGRMTG